MTKEQAIELAKGYAAESIREGRVETEPCDVFEVDWPEEPTPVPVWIVHFEYILDEGVESQVPSSLGIIIDRRTAKRIPFMAM